MSIILPISYKRFDLPATVDQKIRGHIYRFLFSHLNGNKAVYRSLLGDYVTVGLEE